MALGEFQHSLDAKGRMIIPAKLREGLGENFVVTKGLDNCLCAYSAEEWKIFEDKLSKLPMTNPGARKFVRFFCAGAAECEYDSQGRITLPLTLRNYAGLKKQVVSIGAINRVEFWDKEAWLLYHEEEDSISMDLAAEMEAYGI